MRKSLYFLKNSHNVFRICILAFLVVLFHETVKYPLHSRLFPEIIIVFGFFLVLLSVGKDVIMKTDAVTEDRDDAKRSENKRRVLKTGLVIIISFLISMLFGILFVVPAAYIGYLIFLGKRETAGKIFSVTVIVTLLVYGIFRTVFSIPVFKSYLWEWIIGSI